MQPLLDGPRAGLTEELVRDLLQSQRTIQILYGADALDPDFQIVTDIAGYLSAGSMIGSSLTSTIHRTCTLALDADVTSTGWSYLSGFVRPYMVFRDVQSGEEAKFHLGVYTLTTPERELGTEPATLNFAGYDLVYLLRQPIGDSYEVPAGSDPALAAAEVIGLAIPGIEVLVEASGVTLPGQLSWPLDFNKKTTYYEVVDTLLKAIGYKPVWVDWDGVFRIEPFVDMLEVEVDWTFDTTGINNIVSDERTQSIDLYNVPNWFRFVIANLADTPVEGVSMFTWEDNSPMNPGSTVNRGRRIKYVAEVPAPSYDDLVAFGQRVISMALQPAEMFSVKTQPFPLAWHFDAILYTDSGLDSALPLASGNRRLVVATEWRLPLDGMSDMEWTWQTVSDQTATLDDISEVEV